MTMMRKLVQAQITEVGEDEVEVVISTSALARDGHILAPAGCVSENYERNPIWLWSHDTDVPTGNAESIQIDADSIRCRVRSAPRGISARADEINGLVKAGVVRAASIGFDPIEMEPLDPRKPRGGQRITKWEWLESSWVSVPSDTKALVTARSHGDDDMPEIDEGNPAPDASVPPVVRTRAASIRAPKIAFKRGLYQVANLCTLLVDLGWLIDMTAWEAAAEGDHSKVPAMLAAAFSDLGDALLTMTAEELAEAMASFNVEEIADEADEILAIEDRQHIAAATSPAVRSFRRGVAHAKLRAGKALSAETVRCIREAMDLHDTAMSEHRSAIRKHKEGVAAMQDILDRAGVSEAATEASATEETDEGSRATADYQRRQAEMQALAPAE